MKKEQKDMLMKYLGYTPVSIGYIETDSETQWQKDNKDWCDKNHLNYVGDYYVNIDNDSWYEVDDVCLDEQHLISRLIRKIEENQKCPVMILSEEEKFLNGLLNNGVVAVKEEYYLQDKRTHVGNNILWWAKNGSGYTTDITKAGVFSKEEAMRQHKIRPDVDIPWPKNYIDQRLSITVDFQNCNHKETNVELIKVKKPKRIYHCEECGRFISEREYYEYNPHESGCNKCREY